MKVTRLLFLWCLLALLPQYLLGQPIALFDGKTLDGWEGETTKVWRVQDGVIVGGAMAGNPQNEFLCTKGNYRNFKLKLEYRLVGSEGFVNGGVQLRSKRIPQPPNEMIGYQADIGAGYTGCLYDESRRKKVLATADKELVKSLEKVGEWNRYEIRAAGPRIVILLNDKVTVDYTETDASIEQDGQIALQIHGDCKAEISFRNIQIEVLPDQVSKEQADVLYRFGDALAAPSAPLPWSSEGFKLEEQDIMVFTGQTNLVREQKSGALEARLGVSFVDKSPRFRSMAWEGDTVYEQWRELNFGDWAGQMQAAGATVIAAQFGQMESFDGVKRIPEFTSAYHRLLDQFAARTPRLVLISPIPFEKPLLPHAPDLTKRNADVQAYAEAVREIARQRGAIYVDLFTPLSQRAADEARLTDNGIHLTDAGLQVVANLFLQQVGAQACPNPPPPQLLEAIAAKNRLWFDCWRPANWSFVYGDRVSQLFGKPGGNEPSLQKAFEKHKPLIAKRDAEIHALTRGEPVPKSNIPPATPPLADAVAPLTPEQQLAAFTLMEGYEANLFASEKDGVVKPTQFIWDEKGRLWVACSPTYPHTLPGVKPGDYILVLEDTDGDGRADKSWRYAEGLTMVQGLELGDGGLYVCDFDQLLHLKDTDGDGKADAQQVVFSGFGIGDTHQLINSIAYGPDGSLWFTQGLHAFSRVETPWGLSRLHKAGVWKMHPRTQKLETFFNGGKAGHNCWGVAFDDYQQVFHKSGDRPDGYYSVPGMVDIPEPDEYHPTGSLFKSSPKTTALDIIGTKGLPDDIQGCALIGGYFGNLVELHRFQDEGSGFKTIQLPRLLTSSSDAFRPVDVGVGPDGAIYLADWFNPVIGHYQASYADPRRDRSHGRIWRISAKGKAPVRQPELASMNAERLLEQLKSPERWTRYQAKRLLFNLPAEEVIPATDTFVTTLGNQTPDDERILTEVLGIYESHLTARPELVKRLLAAKDGRVRAYGARVVGAWSSELPDALEQIKSSLADTHPRVRLEATVSAARIKKAETVPVVLNVLDSPRDKFIDYALAQTLRALEPQWKPALAADKLTHVTNPNHVSHLKQIAGAMAAPPHPGKAVYDALCLNCHQPDGKGLPGVYPPLTESEWVSGNKDRLIKIMLHGLAGPIEVNKVVYGAQNPLPMPPMGLDDQHTADVLTYIRSQVFGHQASPVTVEEVQKVRAATKDRKTFWTAGDLLP